MSREVRGNSQTMKRILRLLVLCCVGWCAGCVQESRLPASHSASVVAEPARPIVTGADQVENYVPSLRGKRVAVLANPTTIIGNRHLVDVLPGLGGSIS